MQSKSMDWFLYAMDLRHERVKLWTNNQTDDCESLIIQCLIFPWMKKIVFENDICENHKQPPEVFYEEKCS